MINITALDTDKVFYLKLDGEIVKQVAECAKLMLKHCLNIDFKSNAMLKYIDMY